MHSNCTGEKKAVIIGIDYEDSNNELQTCISDTFHLRIELDLMRGFPQSNTRIYTDVESKNRIPTKANIIRAMEWLVESADEDDSLFFYFAGHGGVNSRGQSYICTSDDKEIGSSELRRILVNDLPSGCRLTAVFDCCHSGNILNLKYNYLSTSDLRENDPTEDGKSTQADVVCWSACMEDETADDSTFGKGYLSNSFIKDEEASYLQMFRNIRKACPGEQTPLLTSSHRIQNANKKFIM